MVELIQLEVWVVSARSIRDNICKYFYIQPLPHKLELSQYHVLFQSSAQCGKSNMLGLAYYYIKILTYYTAYFQPANDEKWYLISVLKHWSLSSNPWRVLETVREAVVIKISNIYLRGSLGHNIRRELFTIFYQSIDPNYFCRGCFLLVSPLLAHLALEEARKPNSDIHICWISSRLSLNVRTCWTRMIKQSSWPFQFEGCKHQRRSRESVGVVWPTIK